MQTLDFNKMMENAEKLNTPGKKKFEKKVDERFYEVIRDQKTGNAQSVIRFLAHPEDDSFFVKVYTHYFEEPNGRVYSSICPSTIGEKCAVCDYNRLHWKEYSEEQQKRKRQMKFITNILVVKDPEHPEREGKVFLYKYGVKIQAKIMNLVQPPKDDIEERKPYNIFDFNTGKNFKLKVKTVMKYPNYDESTFSDTPTALFEGDVKKQEELSKNIYLLRDQLPKKDKIKSYEEMNAKLISVLNGESVAGSSKVEDDEPLEVWEPNAAAKPLEMKEDMKKTVEKTVEATDQDDFFKFD